MSIRAGVDTGGTFTDLVLYDEDSGEIRMSKVSSHAERAVARRLRLVRQGRVVDNRHLVLRARHDGRDERADRAPRRRRRAADDRRLPRHPAHPARDAAEPLRPALGQAAPLRPPRALRRRPASGCCATARCSIPLDEAALREEIERLRDGGDVDAIGVSYLFSFVNPDHELRTRELIDELWPEAQVSLSHEVLPRWREYERTSTTVLDAYLKPLMHELHVAPGAGVRRAAASTSCSILRSNGGVMTPAKAKEQPVALVRSGPSGGIMASASAGAAARARRPDRLRHGRHARSRPACCPAPSPPSPTWRSSSTASRSR